MRCHYISCIILDHTNAIPDHMQARTSTYADSTPYQQSTTFVLWPFLHESGFFSSALFSPHNNTSGPHFRQTFGSVRNNSWLQSHCVQSRCSAVHLLQTARSLWGQRNSHQWCTCTDGTLMKPICDFRSVWHDTLRPVGKRNLLYSWTVLPFPSSFVVNFRGWLSLVVVASEKPCPGQRLTLPISWNRFHSLLMALLAIPNYSIVLLFICPDSSVPIIYQVTKYG